MSGKSKSNRDRLTELLVAIRACRLCEPNLPLGSRPVIRARETARILIVGQAPGLRVHETGIPWNDPSGDRLRDWLGLDRETFYDDRHIAIMPMGLCYPGRNTRGGDLPPRPECAPQWADAVLALLPRITLIVLAGRYAQQWHLGDKIEPTLTETVRRWRRYEPRYMPLPHPSFRNNLWLRRNPWFEQHTLPVFRRRIEAIMSADGSGARK